MVLKLRVQIAVEIDALDFTDAARHQAAINRYVEVIQQDYPQATFKIGERRGSKGKPVQRPEVLRRSGVLKPYADRRRATA